MRNINSRKLVNPRAVTASASVLNAALSMAAFAADKKVDTPVRIVADRDMIIFSVGNPRGIAITATTGVTVIAAGETATSLTWADGEPLRLHLARQPQAGHDIIAAQAKGSAQIAFSLPALTSLVAEFEDDAVLLEAEADRGVLIRQGDKFAVLMSCRWRFGNGAAA